jgi:hypothetical protein
MKSWRFLAAALIAIACAWAPPAGAAPDTDICGLCSGAPCFDRPVGAPCGAGRFCTHTGTCALQPGRPTCTCFEG